MVGLVKPHTAHSILVKISMASTGRQYQYHPLKTGDSETLTGDSSGPVVAKVTTDVGDGSHMVSRVLCRKL